MKKYGSNVMAGMGLVLLGVGLFLVKALVDPQGICKALPYVLIGLGCGGFGHGMGSIIEKKTMKKHPDLQKQKEIDANDERNVAITSRAKEKAYDLMVFLFGALMLTFALMNIDMVAVLLLVFAYLFVVGYGIYYRLKYAKEM